MSYKRFLLALWVSILLTLPVQAGILFGRHAKTNPAERVPQLIVTVKTDTDEDKRASAAKELRDYDPAANPDIVGVLIDVLQHDAKPGVRAEAAQSLGKLRPVSQEAGWALEQATHDSSIRVRLQARTSLMGYRLSGYHSPPKEGETVATTPAANGVPPLGQSKRFSLLPAPRTTAPVVNTGETPPPPLANSVSAKTTSASSLPTVPMRPMVVPTQTPKLEKPPAPSTEQGPELPPQ
jgi:HEAT repeats